MIILGLKGNTRIKFRGCLLSYIEHRLQLAGTGFFQSSLIQ